MKILYDGLGLAEPHGGVSRYFTEVIKRLPPDIETEIAVCETRNAYLQEEPFRIPRARCCIGDFMGGRRFRGKRLAYALASRMFPKVWPSSELVNARMFREAAKRGDFDVLHLTTPHPECDCWSVVAGRRPIVVTVHDLIPEIYPSYYRNPRRVARLRRPMLDAAAHVIAVSENTKRDLVGRYGVPESKISVVYHGFLSSPGQSGKSPFAGMKYMLYVGKRDGYKSFGFFLSAVAPLLREDGALNVVCTGLPFTAEENRHVDELGLRGRVLQDFVKDESMSALYRDAVCFVYPSIYEGFGLPILEAFAAGCPVVLARASCFPEVAGDAALYFEPGDADGLASCVRSLVRGAALRREMTEKGVARASRFSWEKCAERTAEIYRMVAGR